MPELPEVETIRRGIEPYLLGSVIVRAIVRNKHLRWPISNEIYTLTNKSVISVGRRARYLLLELIDGWILIHLGMSGNLYILNNNIIPKKHDHIDLIMNTGIVLRYTDPRRLGSWLWTKDIKEHILLKKLGPEPFSQEFNADYLKKKCIKKKTIIKTCLMDNKIVAGIGNIYANESLFVAKIHPNRLASSLSQIEYQMLIKSIRTVLYCSIQHGGTTIKNFLQSSGKPGLFTQKLQVYGRYGKRCFICNSLIVTTKHIARATFYCHNCQK